MANPLERCAALERLEGVQTHQRLALAARAGRLGVWDFDFDTGEIICDEQWMRTMGLPPDRQHITIDEFRSIIHPEDIDIATAETRETAEDLLASSRDYSIEFRIIRPCGEVRWVRSMACVLADPFQKPLRAVGFVTDITDAKFAEERLAQLNLMLRAENEQLSRDSYVDHLTGISNRRRFDQELYRALDQSLRSGEPLAVALIDVDYFKAYNDCFGHPKGDEVLRTIAETIAGSAWRPFDLSARYGGEEFALILPNLETPVPVLERIRFNVERLGIPHPKSEASLHVTISCGCHVSLGGDADVQGILAASDAALYRAKKDGRNRVAVSGFPMKRP